MKRMKKQENYRSVRCIFCGDDGSGIKRMCNECTDWEEDKRSLEQKKLDRIQKILRMKK